jgi:hypothetical protein
MRAAAAVLVACVPVSSAVAEPLHLDERRARPIHVAIELSPPELPARLDHHYSERVVAWFEPGPGPARATVRIAGTDMERVLRSYDPVAGSFGDYVWIFDTLTGHVLSASLDGAFHQRLDWGPMHTQVRADVSARMSTLQMAGHLAPRRRMGHAVFEHCLIEDADCHTVAPRPLDPTTGYVNAVGKLVVEVVGSLGTQTFSPLGEAVFTEMRSDTAVSAR